MREIKYRAWDKENNVMLTISDVDFEAWCSYFTDDRYIIMQSTWLLDKNWKEIYEWDILKFRTKENNFIKVYFDDGWFKMKVWNIISALSYFLWKYQCEIIWNIYENEDLLSSEK